MRTTFDAIGTTWSIEVPGVEAQAHTDLMEKVYTRIERFDAAYSRFRSDSLVTAMSRSAGSYELPDDAQDLIAVYLNLYKVTDGAFTPLIGDVLSEAGYDAAYSFRPGKPRKPAALLSVLEYRHPFLTLTEPALLDFGAAGKGYLVDLVAEMIEQEGIERYTINAGGDIRVRSTAGEAIRIGLEHPDNPDQVIGVVSLEHGSLCGSAGNRRRWSTYHHIIDPRTLRSPDHVKTAWVVSDTARIADALATCLFLVPASQLGSYTFEYAILYTNLSLECSAAFPAEIFTPS